MKKMSFVFIALVLVIVAGSLYCTLYKSVNSTRPTTQASIDTSNWKTYQNTEFGFSIKYPPQYAVKEDVVATSTQWGSRGLLTISRFEDESQQTMRPKFHVVSMQVTLKRQPVVVTGQVYHTITEYQKSGAAAQMVQGAPIPNGELVEVGGIQALVYHFPPGDVVEIQADNYFFIKDDLIYEVSFDASDPNMMTMLQSIVWK